MTTNPKLRLTKLDCVRRQLEMAIELYFTDRDPVSIHTLVRAADQILIDINAHRGGKPILMGLESLKGIVIPGKEHEIFELLTKAKNFFKHADRDAVAEIDFNPSANDVFLWNASNAYKQLAGAHTPTTLAMDLWFRATTPHLFNLDEGTKERLNAMQSSFSPTAKEGFFRECLKGGFLKS